MLFSYLGSYKFPISLSKIKQDFPMFSPSGLPASTASNQDTYPQDPYIHASHTALLNPV